VVALPESLREIVPTLPLLDALASSGRRLVLQAPAALHPLLKLLPGAPILVAFLDELPIPLEEIPEAVLLRHDLHTAWTCWRAGIPRRWGYGTWRSRWWLAPAVPHPVSSTRPRNEHYRELLAALEIPSPTTWEPRLPLPPEMLELGARRLERARLTPGSPDEPLFGFALAGLEERHSRWPWRRWVELGRTLRRQQPRARIVLLPEDRDLWSAVRVHEETGRLHPVLGPDLDSATLGGVLAHLSRLVAPDSAALQLGGALGIPTVGLFASSDPKVWAPSGPRHRIVQAPAGRLSHLEIEEVLAAISS
jgi:ADP-heptose:LPS heptosyltransferase